MSVLFWIAGALTAALGVRLAAPRAGLDRRVAVDGLFLMLAVGLVTSHVLGAVLYRWQQLQHDWTLLLPGSGSASSLGALLGAGLAGALWLRGRGAYASVYALALSLGWAVGRIGCALRHDHLGRVTDVPWAVRVGGTLRHDLGLYELLLALAIFLVLLRVRRHRAALAAMLYAIGRFGLETLRADDLESIGRISDPRIAGFTAVQLVMPLLFLGGLLLFTSGGPRRPPAPASPDRATPPPPSDPRVARPY